MYIFDVTLVAKLWPAHIAQSAQQMSRNCLFNSIGCLLEREARNKMK